MWIVQRPRNEFLFEVPMSKVVEPVYSAQMDQVGLPGLSKMLMH